MKSLKTLHRVDTVLETLHLIQQGADVNARCEQLGVTPLHAANADITAILLANGADVNVVDKCGFTPLHCARDDKCVKLLLAQHAEMDVKDRDGYTPLHHFVLRSKFKNKFSAVETLLLNGADVNLKANNGCSSLHMSKDAALTKLLIKYGADVNARNEMDITPLHCACHDAKKHNDDYLKIIEYLLQNGADVNAQTSNGTTPLDVCMTAETAELLFQYGADANITNKRRTE